MTVAVADPVAANNNNVGEAIYKKHTPILCFSLCDTYVLEITSLIEDQMV